MSRFNDFDFSQKIPGYPCISSPRWSTDLIQVDSGAEKVNQRWEHPLHTFTLPNAIRDHDTFEDVHEIWMAMRGPLFTFPFRDPLDFASVDLVTSNTVPTLSRTDQVLGTGDGVKTKFQLIKSYSRGSQTYNREIIHPILSTFVVGIDGNDPTTISPSFTVSVSRTTGIVTFDPAPPPGVSVTAGFLFDVEVRFESDTAFDGIVQTFSVS